VYDTFVHSEADPDTDANAQEPAGIELPMRSATLEVRGASRLRDISNRKLAQNQTELSKQIVDLRALVTEQNKLLHQLMHHRPSTSTS
jgi:potassium voltage-gated channel Shal-related subfamily D protein 2